MDTRVSPDGQRGGRHSIGKGVGTQIVGGPKIRVGWVKEVSMGLVGGVEGGIQLGYRIGLDGVWYR